MSWLPLHIGSLTFLLIATVLAVGAAWLTGAHDLLLLLPPLAFLAIVIPLKLHQKRRLGRVRIRMPWSERNTIMVALAGGMILMTAARWYRQSAPDPYLVFSLATAGWFLLVGTARFEIRERGVSIFPGVYPWPTILAHTWDETAVPAVLRLELRSRHLTVNWPVPPRLRAAVSEAIARHVPSATAGAA